MTRSSSIAGASLALLVAACAAAPESVISQAAPPPPTFGAACKADAAQSAVGKTYNAPLGEQIRNLSGAKTLRVLRPGQMATLEFSEERVQVNLDERGKVVRVSCG
jgi:hypothetical protein